MNDMQLNLPYFGKRDIFYYFEFCDKQSNRDNKLSELFGDKYDTFYYSPFTRTLKTDKIYCTKFWKDESSIYKAKDSYRIGQINLIIHQMYREDWINCIPDGLDEDNSYYLTNLKNKKKEIKANLEWLEFRKKYKVDSDYKRVIDPHYWLTCKNCGLIPLVCEDIDSLSTACGCGEYGNHHSIKAESALSQKNRNLKKFEIQNHLRLNWNQWVTFGQDVFECQKNLNPSIF